MIDESFFDEKGEVRSERLDEFIAHLHATQARGIYVNLTGPVGNALLPTDASEQTPKSGEKAPIARKQPSRS
jgi:hypothetical protein